MPTGGYRPITVVFSRIDGRTALIGVRGSGRDIRTLAAYYVWDG
jgi:hypothetical protein